jgi:hypothetical protein
MTGNNSAERVSSEADSTVVQFVPKGQAAATETTAPTATTAAAATEPADTPTTEPPASAECTADLSTAGDEPDDDEDDEDGDVDDFIDDQINGADSYLHSDHSMEDFREVCLGLRDHYSIDRSDLPGQMMAATTGYDWAANKELKEIRADLIRIQERAILGELHQKFYGKPMPPTEMEKYFSDDWYKEKLEDQFEKDGLPVKTIHAEAFMRALPQIDVIERMMNTGLKRQRRSLNDINEYFHIKRLRWRI